MVSGSCAKHHSRAQLFRVPLTFECKWFSGAATVTPNVVDWDEGERGGEARTDCFKDDGRLFQC